MACFILRLLLYVMYLCVVRWACFIFKKSVYETSAIKVVKHNWQFCSIFDATKLTAGPILDN